MPPSAPLKIHNLLPNILRPLAKSVLRQDTHHLERIQDVLCHVEVSR